jgi:hypothetical protein
MVSRKKAASDFPPECCAACRFCLGERDEWECWGGMPERVDAGDPPQRGRPTLPLWPACAFFKPREQ